MDYSHTLDRGLRDFGTVCTRSAKFPDNATFLSMRVAATVPTARAESAPSLNHDLDCFKARMFELHKSEIGPSALRIAIAIGGVGLFGAFFLSGKLFWVLWIGLMATLFVRYLIQDKQRTRQIREFASRTGFLFLDDCLPKSFPIKDTSSRGAYSISRAFAGDKSNREILVFDCSLGQGKGKLNRTVVAVRGKPADFGWARFGPDLETEEVGEWALVYGTKRLLRLDEIAELIAEL